MQDSQETGLVSYVLFEIDPTYREEHIIGVLKSIDAAFENKAIAEDRRSQQDIDCGVYFAINGYLTNKLYSTETRGEK